MLFHEILDNYMTTHKITNYKMSQDTGISDSLIGYWRRGKRNPTLDNLIAISNYLNLSIDSLVKGLENNSIMSAFHFSDDELELMNAYKNLDSRGKHRIHTVIYEELDRIEESKKPFSKEKEVG